MSAQPTGPDLEAAGAGGAAAGPPVADQVLRRIAEGSELAGEGRVTEARRVLDEVWDELGPGGDPVHRCAAARAVARVQTDPRAELAWHLEALLAADQVSSRRANGGEAALVDTALHLDLADVYDRLADPDRARYHRDLGHVVVLPREEPARRTR